MHTFAKKVAALSMLLASTHLVYGMPRSDISGGVYCVNRDHTAVIYVVLKTDPTDRADEPFECIASRITDRPGFSSSGNIAFFPNGNGLTLTNITTGFIFSMPGEMPKFSPDEKFVTTQVWTGTTPYQALFNATTGQHIAPIYGFGSLVSPNAPIMLVGKDFGPGGIGYECQDPRIIDMATGKQIGGQLEGSDPAFSPDGQAVVIQQYGRVAFYSTATGKFITAVPGYFAFFIPGTNVAAVSLTLEELNFPDKFYTTNEQAQVIACDRLGNPVQQ